jgi:hypothetical protein
MPLTKQGKRILNDFKKKYGSIKGEEFFYAYINKYPQRTKHWHKKVN